MQQGDTAPTQSEECHPAAIREATAGRRNVARVWPDVDHPADPYPGAAPPVSYVHADGFARGITGGAVDGLPLDAWLQAQGAAPLAGRLPVLAYGSNRSPSKITWLRRELGLGADPV